MTHLEATIKDFSLVRDAEGRDQLYRFRIARAEDFTEVMEQFKRGIHIAERRPDPDAKWLWEVKANAHNHAALSRLFDNFAEVYDAAKSQLQLFG